MKNLLLPIFISMFIMVSCSMDEELSYNVRNVEFAQKTSSDVTIAMKGLLESVGKGNLKTTETDVPALPAEKWSIDTVHSLVQVYPNPNDPYEYFDSIIVEYTLKPVDGIGVQYKKGYGESTTPYAIAPYRTVEGASGQPQTDYYFWVSWDEAQKTLPEWSLKPLKKMIE